MKRLLMVGIPAEVGNWLEAQLPGLEVRVVEGLDAVQAELNRLPYDLLLIDHGSGQTSGIDLLEGLTRAGQLLPPIFYSLPDMRNFSVMFRLSQEFRVKRLLVHPLEPEELLRRLTAQMQISLSRLATRGQDPVHKGPVISEQLKKIWDKHLPNLKERAQRMASANVQSLADPGKRAEIVQSAHQLAGTLGSFGLTRATELAREAEQYLVVDSQQQMVPEYAASRGREILEMLGFPEQVQVESSSDGEVEDIWLERLQILESTAVALLSGPVAGEQMARAVAEARRLRIAAGVFRWTSMRQVATEIEEVLGRPVLGPEVAGFLADRVMELQREVSRHTHGRKSLSGKSILVVGGEAPFWPDLSLALRLQGIQSQSAPLDVLDGFNVQAAIVNFQAPQAEECFQALTRLRQLKVPVLLYAEGASLEHKVRASEIGVRGFLEVNLTSEEILEILKELLNAPPLPGGRILAVDDDPVLLRVLSRTLSEAGYQVTTEQEPLLFWERLQEVDPDLLILDVDMPKLSGIELCRVVRNNSRWGGIPVIFLTAERDAQTVERIFGAGGDDYVLKPLVGGELLTRIRNRMQRFLRSWSDMQSGRQGDSRALMPKLEWLLQVSQRFHQPLTFSLLRLPEYTEEGSQLPALERRLRLLSQAGDLVARWDGQTLLFAMLACSRQQARERLDDPEVKGFSASTALVTYPSDGAEISSLIEQLQGAIAEVRTQPSKSNVPLAAAPGEANHDVYLVDDDLTLADLVRSALEPEGFTISCFRSAEEAKQALLERREAPKVILLDVNLEGEDGYALLGHLESSGVLEKSRVIMLTGEANSQQMVFRAIEAGAFDYVSKPFQPWVLLARVKRAWSSAE